MNSEKKLTRTRKSERIVKELGLDLKAEAIELVNELIAAHNIEANDIALELSEQIVNIQTEGEFDPASPNTHYTLREVNNVLGFHDMYVRKLFRAQKIENIKIKGRFYVEKEYFHAYCAEKNIKVTIE